MSNIRPFNALRPLPAQVDRVSALPYELVSTEGARALAAGNPLSFLYISRAEIGLPAATNPCSDAAYPPDWGSTRTLPRWQEPAPPCSRVHFSRMSRGRRSANRAQPPKDGRRPGILRRRSVSTVPKWLGLLLCVGAGALILRMIYFAELRHTPLFSVLVGDGQQYDLWAQQIADGQWIGTEIFYQTPLYPYFLAVIFKLLGHQLLAARAIQAVLGAASCVFLGLAGRSFFSERAGLIAAGLLAIYPPAIFFDGLIQKSSLDLFLVTLLLALVGAFQHRPRWMWLVVAAAVLGAFTLNRENARVIYPIIVVWLLCGFRNWSWTRRWTWVAMFTASLFVVLLPVAVRNYYVGGAFLISTSQLGPNLYIGNHPGARGAYEELVPGHGNAAYERADATRLAEEAAGRKLSPGDVSEYWVGRAVEYIRGRPWNWLTLMGRKLLLTFHRREVADTESIEAYAEYSRVLRWLPWINFGIMLPFAALGAWQTLASWRRLAVLYAMFAGLAVSVAIFYVMARYRFPIVPATLLFAAAALAGFPDLVRDRRRLLIGAVLAVVVAVASNVPIETPVDGTFLNIARVLVKSGQPAAAIPLLAKAITASSADPEGHFELGVAFNDLGDKPSALEQFAAAARLRPGYFEAESSLALALQETGKTADALEHFREAVRLEPTSAKAHDNLGVALAHIGKAEEAIGQYEESLRLELGNAKTHNNLATALQEQGRFREAMTHYAAAVKLKPDYSSAHNNFALALAATGQTDAAIEHFQEALRLQPDTAEFHINFGDLLLALGRMPQAVDEYQQAVKLSPNLLGAQFRLAQAYARAGRLNDAVMVLDKALAVAQATGQSDGAQRVVEALRILRERMPKR